MQQPISISAISSISALRANSVQVWNTYIEKPRLFSKMESDWVSKISRESEAAIAQLVVENREYKNLDRTFLERGISENSLAIIIGYGFTSETLKFHNSMPKNGDCFQKSMQQALDSAGLETVDALIMHAPGTVKGDIVEKNAVDIVFGKQLPLFLLISGYWVTLFLLVVCLVLN